MRHEVHTKLFPVMTAVQQKGKIRAAQLSGIDRYWIKQEKTDLQTAW
jgi:hypothetical protein